jgi:hypothetical protein
VLDAGDLGLDLGLDAREKLQSGNTLVLREEAEQQIRVNVVCEQIVLLDLKQYLTGRLVARFVEAFHDLFVVKLRLGQQRLVFFKHSAQLD